MGQWSPVLIFLHLKMDESPQTDNELIQFGLMVVIYPDVRISRMHPNNSLIDLGEVEYK